MNRQELAVHHFREFYKQVMQRIPGLTHLEARSAMQTVLNETAGLAVGEIVAGDLTKIADEGQKDVDL